MAELEWNEGREEDRLAGERTKGIELKRNSITHILQAISKIIITNYCAKMCNEKKMFNNLSVWFLEREKERMAATQRTIHSATATSGMMNGGHNK